MRHATLVKPDGSAVTVGPDLKPLGDTDIDRRVLHVLPKLFVPAHLARKIKVTDIDLQITATAGVEIAPAGEIVIRQPYPNTRYFVAGSEQSRNGWVINLPEGVSEFDIVMSWVFAHPYRWWIYQADDLEVQHLIHVKLLPGDFRTYTMDSSCWPKEPGWQRENELTGKVGRSAISLMGHPDDADPREKTHRDILKISDLVFTTPETGSQEFYAGHYIEENLSIPAIAYEQAWSIHAHSAEQLHEVKQVSTFSNNQDQHRKNASIELPASVFLEAIQLAESVPFDRDSDFWKPEILRRGIFESHPALQLLCKWFEDNRVDTKAMKCGFAMPWVRVRDNDEYWCGYYETPNEPMDVFEAGAPATAVLGESTIVTFSASHEHSVYSDERGLENFLADGQPLSQVGIPKELFESGEYDEAWYSLEALASFRRRFPAAFAEIQSLAA